MLKETLLAALLLTAIAAADVTLVSACPKEVNVRVGDRQEGMEFRQSLTVALPDPATVVVDADGKALYNAKLTNDRFWVLHPKGAQEAGLLHASGTPRAAVSFFNALPYTIVLHLNSEKVDPDPEPIRVPSLRLSAPVNLPAESFSIELKDEGGNPIGRCYSPAKVGNYYLVYRKHDTLYDLDTLGTIP